MKEIKATATAPTPQDWIELVRENERLVNRLSLALGLMDAEAISVYLKIVEELENKTND